jgi:type IV pilus assembly protein PilO
MKLGSRELIYFALLLGVLVGSWWFGFRPMEARAVELTIEADAKRGKVEQVRAVMRQVEDEDLTGKLDELQKAIAFFEQKLPRAKDVEDVLHDVTASAEGCGLGVEEFEELRVRHEAAYSEQPIRLKLTGSFESFYQFLLKLERLPRITRLTDMELRKLETRGQRGITQGDIMEATLTLSVYFESGTTNGKD